MQDLSEDLINAGLDSQCATSLPLWLSWMPCMIERGPEKDQEVGKTRRALMHSGSQRQQSETRSRKCLMNGRWSCNARMVLPGRSGRVCPAREGNNHQDQSGREGISAGVLNDEAPPGRRSPDDSG
jgi:hypothetical protein